MSWQGKASLDPTESAITAFARMMKTLGLSEQPCGMPEVLECCTDAAVDHKLDILIIYNADISSGTPVHLIADSRPCLFTLSKAFLQSRKVM